MSDLIAFGITGFAISYTSTRPALGLSYIIGITGGCMYILFDSEEFLIPVFVTLSRLGACMAYNTGYVSVNRLFPTRF